MSSLPIHGYPPPPNTFHPFPNFHNSHSKTPLNLLKSTSKYSSLSSSSRMKIKKSVLVIKNCSKKEDNPNSEDTDKDYPPFDPMSVEKPPYYSYMDSTSGQLEPASGARASIPGQDYWPEGTASRVRAARAPKPTGKSTGEPSFGKNPGSRRGRKKHLLTNVAAGSSENAAAELAVIEDSEEEEEGGEGEGEAVELSSEYVVYKDGDMEEEMSDYEFNKNRGNPHPFIDPSVKREIKEPLTSEELWWNWKKPEKEQWSRWQRRRPDSETVFVKAMVESGQIKIYGDHPTLTETSLYRARRHLFKEERLQAEHKRLEQIGPLAYYSEWVEAWKRDTSKEAVQKHFEETGEDENTQLIEMFQLQTDREYRIMMGTDIRIRRDPLAMRMREDQIKEIWGGDPVYPTINYIQDPEEVIDYRGPEFHEPTPNMLSYLMEEGKIISRDDLEQILAKEKTEELEVSDIDEAMARAVDIGENEDEEEDSEVEEEADEKLPRNWSVLKSSPELQKTKGKAGKKDTPVSLDDAIDESENLTDFLLDFNEDE